MKIGQYFLEAMESLTSNKLRSGLTILGIVIGVAAVISMLAIGNGAQNSINSSINSIGTNLIFISSGARGVTNPKPLTLADANALADPSLAPDVDGVAPTLQSRVTITAQGQTETTTVTGVTPEYATLRDETVDQGSFFTQTQLTGRAAVAVIGPTTATNLFGTTDNVVGQTIRIQGQPFQVIGVLQSKGGGSLGSQDDVVFIPLTTAQVRLIHRGVADQVDQILVQATSADTVTAATNEVTQILDQRHNVAPGAEDFTLLTQQEILSTASSITGTLTIFLGGIGAISLLVGGIGIMNIMLVSVTERTREIGLRKALGARKRDILIQFLTESSLLSLFGGIVGIGFGWLIAYVVGRIAAASNTPINPTVGLQAILLATLFSTAVGLFFGAYPANRAASLEPVEALRYE